MREKLLTPKNRILFKVGIFAGASALFLSGCGDDEPRNDGNPESQAIEAASTDDRMSVPIFTPDNRRITFIPEVVAYTDSLIAVIEYCDGGLGGDLITITEQSVDRGAAGGVDRAVGHEYCEDGVLTASDFYP